MRTVADKLVCVDDLFNKTQYIIPQFQRPYTWGEQECAKLWEDIVDFYDKRQKKDTDDDAEPYFLGTMVIYPTTFNDPLPPGIDIANRYDVVDGQQRLTTLTLLTAALSARASNYTALKGVLLAKNSRTGVTTDILRVLTNVLEDRPNELAEIIHEVHPADLERERVKRRTGSRRNNFVYFRNKIDEWIAVHDSDQFTHFIDVFLNRVGMLPILCASQEMAFRIFEVVNNRGKPLAEADIFKAKILDNLKKGQGRLSEEQKKFLLDWKSWCDEGVEDSLFKALMRIRIGQSGKTDTTDIGILKYFELEENKECFVNPEGLINDLKRLFAIMQWDRPSEINILWAILEKYPNEAWKWPAIAYLYQHGNVTEKGFGLTEDDQLEFINLCRALVKYVYGKGLIESGTLNDLKSVSYKQCAHIFTNGQTDDSLSLSDEERDRIAQWIGTLGDCECYKAGFQYGAGLVMLCSYLLHSDDYSMVKFSRMIENGRIDVEHICPKSWANADGWSKEDHEKLRNTIGNLIPLEKAINIQLSDSCFARKRNDPGRKNCKSYKDSLSPEANELASLQQEKWLPDDVRKRTALKAEVLKKFFLGEE